MADQVIDVTRKHETYEALLPHWEFYWDSYKGGYIYKEPLNSLALQENVGIYSYLYAHDSEYTKTNKFRDRHNKSFYTNWCALSVNTFQKYIFGDKYPIVRDYEEGSGYQDYVDDINLSGMSINTFMRRQMVKTAVPGLSYILVDRPPKNEKINTLAQQKEAGIRAYAQCISAEQVTDWSIDPITGSYNWVLIKVSYRNDTDWTEKSTTEDRYYLWTKTETWYLNDLGEAIIQEGIENPVQHNLGFIPIIRCTYTDVDADGIPESMIANIVDLNREIYNIDSMYQEELYKLAFAQLMKQKGDKNWTEDMDASQNKDKVSTDKWMEYDPNTNPPEYLIFPTSALVEKRMRRDELVQDILRLSNLGNHTATDTTSMQSGLAMGFAYSDTYSTAAHISKQMEEYEDQLWGFIKAFDQPDGNELLLKGDIIVKYPSTFDVRSEMESRENYKLNKQEFTKSPTAMVKADMERVLDTLNVDEQEALEIEKELEEGYKADNELELGEVTDINEDEIQTQLTT